VSPDECIAGLDNALAANGETFTLRRLVGTLPNVTNVDVDCLAWVTALSVEQIAAGIPETELNVIFSPTQINQAQWPGGTVPALPPFNVDQRVPRANVDKAIVQSRLRTVSFVNPVSIGGELVRINMRVAG
jgi:hypothetical protein